MIKISGPKWVKKANQWCITYFLKPKSNLGKTTQEIKWFSSLEEAEKFISKLDI